MTQATTQNPVTSKKKCSLWQCFLRKALCFFMREGNKSHFSFKTLVFAENPVDVSSFPYAVLWNLAWAVCLCMCMNMCSSPSHLCLTSWCQPREVWPSDTWVWWPHDLWQSDPIAFFCNFRQRLSTFQTDDQWHQVNEMLQICLGQKKGLLSVKLYFRCVSRWLWFSILTAHTVFKFSPKDRQKLQPVVRNRKTFPKTAS